MLTFALIVLAVLVVAGLIAVVVQMCNSPMMFVMHCCCGTFGVLFNVLALIFQAIGEAVFGSN